MKRTFQFRLALVLLGLLSPVCALAQYDGPISLGDFARSLRREKQPAAPVTIDNDNLFQVLEQVQSQRLGRGPLFSWNGSGNTFQATFPDGTCSLSFNANATSLLTVPYVAEELPQDQLARLDGPASIDGDTLQVSIYNGTGWSLKEITVGLTIVRRPENNTAYYGAAKLLPAVADNPPAATKPSDLTLLLHLKGTVVPLGTTILQEKLPAVLAPGQEWHWAIVQAKGIRPSPLLAPLRY
ncbi:MAG: hypothetical protein LAO09_04865 [Acidobacteriia bacterium]|nr:hypothetical protein [Terriglobia bacterium]